MLTDYHTHLRHDDPGASAAQHFTESNVDAYLETAARAGITELGFSEHVHRFRQALDVWTHPFWREQAVDDLDDYVEFVCAMKMSGRAVKLGIELDYIPGCEDQLAELIEGRPWDYVIGSVHFLADRAVDHQGYDAWRRHDPDEVWREYFATLGAAAASGLYDVLAHPDLVKIWGSSRPAPSADPRSFYELAIEQIASSGVAVEVSTAGLRKPVGEIYPSRDLLELVVEAGNPLALSSDAHAPDQVGYRYEDAIEHIRSAGVKEICVFDQRQRRMEELG